MISRRIIAALAVLCAIAAPVHAQKTPAQLNAEIDASFPDNNAGAITPQVLRNVTHDMVNSNTGILTADTTFYFRNDGNDANTCEANTPAAACATVQGVLNKAFSINLNGHNLILQAGAAGTYNGCATVAAPQIGKGTITLNGNISSPSTYVLAGDSCGASFPNGGGAVVRVANAANLTVKGFKFQTTTTGWGLYAYAAQIVAQNVEFAAVAEGHIGVEANGTVLNCNNTISGGGILHFHAFTGGSMIGCTGGIDTLVGTPAFSAYFAGASEGGLMRFATYSFAGTGATGTRFVCHVGCVMSVAGDSLTFFPGDQAGVTDLNGFYSSRTGLNNVTIKNDDITSLNIYSNATTTYPAWAIGRNGTQELIAAVATAGTVFFTGTSPGDSVLFSLGHDLWLGKAGAIAGVHVTATDTQFPQGNVKILSANDATGLSIYSDSVAQYPAWALGRNGTQELFGAVATAGTIFFTGTSPGDGVIFSSGHDLWLGKAGGGTAGLHLTGTDARFPQGVAVVAPQSFAALTATSACAAGTKGGIAVVTDSNTAVWGANIAAGGANVVQAFCNGSNWTVTGK